jgi:hypothetical protein
MGDTYDSISGFFQRPLKETVVENGPLVLVICSEAHCFRRRAALPSRRVARNQE